MPQRFIFSLRFSSKVFLRILAVSFAMIIFMGMFRLNLYFLSVFHATSDVDILEVLHSFRAGVRFDVLVIGFILIPITLVLLIQAILQKWQSWSLALYKVYLSVVWTLICGMSYMDFFHFAKYGSRMRWEQYHTWSFEEFYQQMSGLQANQVTIFTVISLLLLALGLMMIRGLKFGHWKDEYSPSKGSPFEVTMRVLLPFVLVALAARGTVEPHHLGLEHSRVSSNTSINEMALNAVWCFDK